MIGYKFGDIILVKFPFTDQTSAKKRPAVIISSTAYNQYRPDIIIMAITSQSHSSNYFGDVRIIQWQHAGLLKPSVIKPILTTIEKSLAIRKLGSIMESDRIALIDGIQSILGV
ncbi:MAG: type II toxin-antitoxin system PemK/MazF family toxin [Desulfobacula sp.]|jgi:mRNA interferase MazF